MRKERKIFSKDRHTYGLRIVRSAVRRSSKTPEICLPSFHVLFWQAGRLAELSWAGLAGSVRRLETVVVV